jgi:hypothetical protein
MEVHAKLEITLLSDGRIKVSGPIDNKILAYGMLEAARKSLDDYVPPSENPVIALPRNFKLPIG